MKQKYLLLLSMATGLLLTLSWPVNGFAPIVFVALVPILFVQQQLGDSGRKGMFWHAWLAFLIWNVLTTWWIWHSTAIGSILAFVLNALFTAVIFQLYHLSRKKLFNNKKGLWILVFYWISWEYFHMNWDLTWSWLNLGNVFATQHTWIQWYEYTGALGGTLWVLIINILVFELIQTIIQRKTQVQKIVKGSMAILTVAAPIVLSLMMYHNYAEAEDPYEIVVVQPNIDPYNEQYQLQFDELLDRNFELIEEVITENTRFVVSPESAIQEDIWEGYIDRSRALKRIQGFINSHPGITVVIGATTYKHVDPENSNLHGARKFRDRDKYYFAYNTAIMVEGFTDFQLHHKSKLTPGVEAIPSWGILKPLESFAIDLGGTTGTLGVDEYPVAFKTTDEIGLAPIICYESVYGEFVADIVKQGADFIFVITNDGWWGNTPGHRQHFLFSVLRAIETRRSVARSANTGTSAFINQRGDVSQATDYWVPAVIKTSLNANQEMTYYVKNGDYIARISAFISALVLLIAFVRGYLKNKPNTTDNF